MRNPAALINALHRRGVQSALIPLKSSTVASQPTAARRAG